MHVGVIILCVGRMAEKRGTPPLNIRHWHYSWLVAIRGMSRIHAIIHCECMHNAISNLCQSQSTSKGSRVNYIQSCFSPRVL